MCESRKGRQRERRKRLLTNDVCCGDGDFPRGVAVVVLEVHPEAEVAVLRATQGVSDPDGEGESESEKM